MRWPTQKEVFSELRYLQNELRSYSREDLDDGEGNVGTDVRIQVMPSGLWYFHSGDSSYDQDHRGFWGDGFISVDDTAAELHELARDLINGAKDMEAM